MKDDRITSKKGMPRLSVRTLCWILIDEAAVLYLSGDDLDISTKSHDSGLLHQSFLLDSHLPYCVLEMCFCS